ncbi:MAG TPA: hypothetical protein PKE29_02620 [Phycisphaerales bacterium]|nr:hypothetical protein [Phycisphaerales bacterium]
MPDGATVTFKVHLTRGPKTRRELKEGEAPPRVTPPEGRTPHISKLMALAIRFDRLITTGAVRNQSDLAKAGHVTSARVSQIMNLNHLAPDIQEEILFLPRVTLGRCKISEQVLRPLTCTPDWTQQRRAWARIQAENLKVTPQPGTPVSVARGSGCGKPV